MKRLLPLSFALLPFFGLAQNYDTLVWADEFGVDGAVDSALWFHQTQLPIPGSWYNGEVQHYTDELANSQVVGGFLELSAIKETYTDQGVTKEHTSARLNSKYAFTYGRVEVRAKLPTGVGTWPAIWMLGQNITEPGAYWETQGYGTTPWPWCGEIDIMEHWGHNQDHVSSAIHTPSSYGGTVTVGGMNLPGASVDYHVYSAEWSPTKIEFAVDSVVFYTYEPSVRDTNTWPFDRPQYLLLNIAIQPSIDPNFTSSAMSVDYVRVYQSSALSTDELEAESVEVYPNPARDRATLIHPYRHASVQVFSATGELVIERRATPLREELNVENWPVGTYLVQLKDEQSGQIVVRRLQVGH